MRDFQTLATLTVASSGSSGILKLQIVEVSLNVRHINFVAAIAHDFRP